MFNLITPWAGELAALAGAMLWAIASLIYARIGANIPPLVLNWLKGTVGIVLILCTLMLLRSPWPIAPPSQFAILTFSGVIGIGLGDTALLKALNALGARRGILMETLASPFTALLAWVVLGETLNTVAMMGILLTLGGVTWVITEKIPATTRNGSGVGMGLLWGILAALAQAVGMVSSRFILVDQSISPLWSSLIRLTGGAVVLLLLLWRQQGRWVPAVSLPRLSGRAWVAVIIAATGGTYLGIWLQQIALQLAPAAIAQTLMGTSPIFILPLVAFLGEKVSLRAVLGVGVAIAGIALLFQT